MRLKQIEIKDYNQFEHLVLDLTYPIGHDKEGLPLDKICIIGDNGTGKTTILKLIRDFHKQDVTLKAGFEYTFNKIKFRTSGIKIDQILYFPTGPDLSNLYTFVNQRFAVQKKRYYDLSDKETLIAWMQLRKAVQDSFNEEIRIRKEFFTKAVNENDMEQIQNAVEKLDNYKKANPNGLEKFKHIIDQILNRFHLELDTNIKLNKIMNESFLKIKTMNGGKIPINSLSSGTKQLIYNILPLYSIETGEDTLILIDEPERSLYPNTQKILIDFYTGISPKSQFIFATHSPIIAAQFEPWEVIDLRFNEKGKVERKLYYNPEKENHVDYYFIHPEYLRWDSLFETMFGLDEESNPKRIEKLMELASLDRKIKNEPDKQKKKALWKQYEKLANLLDWKTNGTNCSSK